MSRLARRIPQLLLAALLSLAAAQASAANDDAAALSPARVSETGEQLRQIEQAVRVGGVPDSEQLGEYLGRIPPLRETAQQCINQNQGRLDTVEENLKTLGTGGPGEATGVRQQRSALEARRDEITRQLQLCRVLLLRANDLQDRVTRLRQEQLAERLEQREASALEIIAANLRNPQQLWTTAKLFILRDSGISRLNWVEGLGLVGLILFCAGGAMFVRRPMLVYAGKLPGGPTISAGFYRSLMACSAEILPPLVTSIAASIYLTFIELESQGWALITLLSYGLAAYYVLVFLIRLFLAPCPPAEPYLPLPEAVLRSVAGRLRTLAILALVVSLFSATLVVEGFPEPVRQFLRLVVATILIIALTRLIWLL
ncbi:MAG: hypothetical protein R3225_06940, partial [Halofilum sp. (in: g-proteobacteria)]|nr:hypothetical protein [Halofilum sp. (in: g-proteobacteria)]